MSKNWEASFQFWSGPLSDTEEEKCARIESAIRAAVDKHTTLRQHVKRVRAQGSWRNNTNVRQESDVDVYVLSETSFSYELPAGVGAEEIPIFPATYSYAEYKDHLGKALSDHFGPSAVRRGNKAFDIGDNSYRVTADVVACFPYREYRKNAFGGFSWEDTGVALYTDAGLRIANYPELNYANGVRKNDATSRRFKRVVRILKRLREDLHVPTILRMEPLPGYLVECMVYNVPNHTFEESDLTPIVRNTLVWLYNALETDDRAGSLREVNERKFLFDSSQGWTREQARAFLLKVWQHLGLS